MPATVASRRVADDSANTIGAAGTASGRAGSSLNAECAAMRALRFAVNASSADGSGDAPVSGRGWIVLSVTDVPHADEVTGPTLPATPVRPGPGATIAPIGGAPAITPAPAPPPIPPPPIPPPPIP